MIPAFWKNSLGLRKEASDTTASERARFITDKLTKTPDCNGNFWMEMRNLGLLPKADIHGFSLDLLNKYFAHVSFSPSENPNEALQLLQSSSSNGFTFSPVSFNDVILTVSHFTTQARGEYGIPQRVVAKALPSIGNFLVKIFNTSLHNNTFPKPWKKSQLTPLKKISAIITFRLSSYSAPELSVQGSRKARSRSALGFRYP